MDPSAVDLLLESAQIWAMLPTGTSPALVAGWEDGDPFCAAMCTTDAGLAFCRRCPEATVRRVVRTHRAAGDRCRAGVRLLAFPIPDDPDAHASSARPTRIGVLRIAGPTPREAAAAAGLTNLDPAVLRRAARLAPRPDGLTVLAAARRFRRPDVLHDWQVRQRDRAADARRAATTALAQVIVSSGEFRSLYRSSERQRAQLARRERQVARLAREVLRARDAERARVAHEIHDTAAQSMVSAYRFLEAARASVASTVAAGGAAIDHPAALSARHRAGAGASERHLASASEMLLAAIAEVRAVLGDLLPPGLEELGLGAAVRGRLERMTEGTEIAAAVVGDLPRMPAPVEQAIYGMTLEAISNAVRHARPTTITVELGQQRGRAVVVVRDDGIGFDPAGTVRSADQGLGLVGLGHQAGWLGGRATIRSSPGLGTSVRISVPLDPGLGSARPGRRLEPVDPVAIRLAGA